MSHTVIAKGATVISLMLCVVVGGAGWMQTQKEKKTMSGQAAKVRFINRAPLCYSHVVEVKGGRTLYIAGQIALDKDGNLVGRGDFRAQVKQVFENPKFAKDNHNIKYETLSLGHQGVK